MALIAQVAQVGETDDWIARVTDPATGEVVYIEAGFHDRAYAENVARTMALALPAAKWFDVKGPQ